MIAGAARLGELLKWQNAVLCEGVAMAGIKGHLGLSELRAAQDTRDVGAGRRGGGTRLSSTV